MCEPSLGPFVRLFTGHCCAGGSPVRGTGGTKVVEPSGQACTPSRILGLAGLDLISSFTSLIRTTLGQLLLGFLICKMGVVVPTHWILITEEIMYETFLPILAQHVAQS